MRRTERTARRITRFRRAIRTNTAGNPRGRTRVPRIFIALAMTLAAGMLPPTAGGGIVQAASTLPSRPLPADYVEAFGEGKVLALHYAASYVCLTTPSSDVDPPYGRGDGVPEAKDPKEYQLPPCFLGDTGTGSIPPFAPDGKPLSQTRKLYGIALAGDLNTPSLYATNTKPLTDVQTQCAQPGLPYSQYKGPVGTCLMHPSLLHVTLDPKLAAKDPRYAAPDPLPLPQHSHIVEGTSSPLVWWQAVGTFVFDRSIFPDLNGHCPAGPPKCLTSLKALRDAQKKGLVTPDVPSNIFFYFSVQPEAIQPGLPSSGSGSPFYCPPARHGPRL